MTTKEKIKSFEKELSYIKDDNLREFVENILDGTGDWFYHDPASTSGKYHPKFALGDGGLLRHTRAVVYWVQELSRTELFSVNERQVELLTAAAILHDIRKHTATGNYIANHARASSNMIVETQHKHTDLLSEEDAKYIAEAVSTHMGVWGVKDGERKPMSDSEKLLHLADYCASRKEIDMDFPEPIGVNIVVESKTNDEQFSISFGKHRGKTLEEVYNIDKDYLLWIINQDNFFDKDIQQKIKTYVDNKK